MNRIFFLLLLLISGLMPVMAQRITPEQYIEKYKDLAIREMKRMGVPAAITLAQGMHETDNGNSELVLKSNNHFGIKCKGSWTAGGVSHDDDAPGECFRTYKDAEASYRDHSNFLRGNNRYSPLFQLDPNDYKAWAYGLRKAGYATNPKYPEIIIKNIERYGLQQYSLTGAESMTQVNTDGLEDDKPGNVATADAPIPNKETGMGAASQINGIKCIYAEKGTSLLAIAVQYEIDLNKLLEYNDLQKDGILNQSQYIYLQKKSKTGPVDVYVVQDEKSPYEVAQNKGMSLASLLEYNQLHASSVMKPAQVLKLRPSSKPITQPTATVITPKTDLTKTHTVQPKEGLYSIARQYRVTVAQLREWNHLSSDNLKVGQVLVITP